MRAISCRIAASGDAMAACIVLRECRVGAKKSQTNGDDGGASGNGHTLEYSTRRSVEAKQTPSTGMAHTPFSSSVVGMLRVHVQPAVSTYSPQACICELFQLDGRDMGKSQRVIYDHQLHVQVALLFPPVSQYSPIFTCP